MRVEIAFVTIIILLVGLLSYLMFKPNIIANTTLSEEKCNTQGNNADNCWHALAHQTMNKEFCNKIKDNERKEHCIGHIPS